MANVSPTPSSLTPKGLYTEGLFDDDLKAIATIYNLTSRKTLSLSTLGLFDEDGVYVSKGSTFQKVITLALQWFQKLFWPEHFTQTMQLHRAQSAIISHELHDAQQQLSSLHARFYDNPLFLAKINNLSLLFDGLMKKVATPPSTWLDRFLAQTGYRLLSSDEANQHLHDSSDADTSSPPSDEEVDSPAAPPTIILSETDAFHAMPPTIVLSETDTFHSFPDSDAYSTCEEDTESPLSSFLEANVSLYAGTPASKLPLCTEHHLALLAEEDAPEQVQLQEGFLLQAFLLRRSFFSFSSEQWDSLASLARPLLGSIALLFEDEGSQQMVDALFVDCCRLIKTQTAPLEKELGKQNIHLNFYDIVVDKILFKALAEIRYPSKPATALRSGLSYTPAVMQKTILVSGARKLIGYLLEGKSELLKPAHALISQILPLMAWGLWAAPAPLNSQCNNLIALCKAYYLDLFSLNFPKDSSAADKVFTLTQKLLTKANALFEEPVNT